MSEQEQINYLLDNVITEDNQLWQNLRTFSDNLSEQILKVPKGSPILLTGDWGSGKSSVLQVVKTKLDPKKAHCIWFDAWFYEQETNLLPALTREIYSNLKENRNKKEVAKLFRRTMNLAGTLALKALPVIAGVNHLKEFADMFRGITPEQAKGDKGFFAIASNPEQSISEHLVSNFHSMVHGAIKNEPLVILIDDLDRCSPESSINLLENIRLLLNQLTGSNLRQPETNIKFVIAMDKTTLTESVSKKFQALNNYESNRYLEKLFPFVYTVPSLTQDELHQYISGLYLKVRGETYDAAKERRNKDKIIESLSESPFYNPRLIKRCINRFFQLRDFNKRFDEEQKDIPTLLVWIAASERWPLLRRLMQKKAYAFWQKMAEAVHEGKDMEDTEASQLLAQIGFRDFFKTHFSEKLEQALLKFDDAEKELTKHGL